MLFAGLGQSVWWKTVTSRVKMLPSASSLGQHFQALGHSFSPYGPLSRQKTHIYYMVSPASGQDELSRALCLATRAGKMERSCPLGTTRCIPQEKIYWNPYNNSFIDRVCSFFFCEFMDLDFVSVHKHAKKGLGQYPAILTSHLVNNPYTLHFYLGDMGVRIRTGHTVGWCSSVSLTFFFSLMSTCARKIITTQ